MPLGLFLCVGVPLANAETELTRSDLSETDQKRVEAVTRPATDFSEAEPFERMQAGATTSRRKADRDAFSHPSANISFEQQQDFLVGNGLFKKIWVSSPSSTQASDGLGPLYNARSCQRCHLKDGRGHPPVGEETASSLAVKLGVPRDGDEEGRLPLFPEPVYGRQLQTFGVPGADAEAQLEIAYERQTITYPDGVAVHLRKPRVVISEPAYGAFSDEARLSPRVAPPMIGLGLIEAIHPADILRNADVDDKDGDGVSGRVPWLDDEKTSIGRFGWKATAASVRRQSVNAFSVDIGISTPEVPANWGDCTENQPSCRNLPHGEQAHLGVSEAPEPVMDLVTFYSKNLAVPVRREEGEANVLAGKKLFYETGCVACHHPKYVTSRKAEQKEHRFQLIWPYSDFLLHDMGEGLADNFPEGAANGREWRTPALWGLGLTQKINPNAGFLHDGRARTLEEAILWHGGEAEGARNRFMELDNLDRRKLIRFLSSL
ncbi:di-heme oxidoredictase family protein [Coralliovum pocilloporae]|uniref:di-heme oxidoreductase family protein n=1 Tax=Coralliovum pocilloporae TaxID=3066369 RepID=UPI0033073280